MNDAELFEHGVLIYGFESEKQMWEFKGLGGDWQDLPDHANYDDVIKGMSSRFYEHRRKTSAVLPFDLQMAKADDVIELNIGDRKIDTKR